MTTPPDRQLNDDDLELLSAYIDNQLAAGERGALEERLRREPALRGALEELHGTVALLHDLPLATPPRSFTLDPAAFAPRRSPLFSWLRMGASLASVLLALTFAVDLVARGGATTSAPAMAPQAAAPGQQRSALTLATSAPAAEALPAPPAAPLAAEATAASAPAAAAGAAAPTSAPAATAAAPATASAPEATAAPAAMAATSALEASGAITRSADANTDTAPTTAAQPTPALAGQPDQAVGGAPLASPAAPVATSVSLVPTGVELSQPPIRPIRLVEIGLAALVLLLGLGALWVRRRESRL